VTELETERLRLRAWRDDDVVHLERLGNDERFTRYLGPRRHPQDELEKYRRRWHDLGYGQWALEERATGRFVGRAGLHRHRLWPSDVEVGWGLDPAFWGRGYATEAGAAAIRYAFDVVGAPRVVSILHPENEPSIRVAERLGERPYATVPWDDTGIELLVYAIERGEWRAGSRLQSSG
jgi:RimJ/RimL family protein N-acetyltransferase